MNKRWAKIKIVFSLGLLNVVRVALYRVGIRFGINKAVRIRETLPSDLEFFSPLIQTTDLTPSKDWCGQALYFGWYKTNLDINSSPNWFLNPMSGRCSAEQGIPWWKISDFDPHVGDIKGIWEASRFAWLIAMAQRVKAGEEQELEKINQWLSNWIKENPAYLGQNWKCGQEASIRVLHVAFAAMILGQYKSVSSILQFVQVHLARIAPTLSYARAQENNHGTSEAAALFVGGSWLNRELENRQARRWQEEGRRRLEERVLHLVEEDGSFSQHSVVYHRVLIDTLSMAEVWRRKLGLKKFSDTFYKKAKAATLWLKEFTNVASGDAPNIGPNDGTRLLPLSDTDYRDFRPSVQLASVLFFNARSYAKQGSWNLPCKWLNIPIPDAELEMGKSKIMDSGGYAVIRNQRSSVYLRFPRFRFRPTHADALHVDFWIDNKNILRDGGSFSYNTEDVWLDYFPGTVSHNTVQFDERDQMPRISRFLFGNWLATKFHSKIENENGIQSFSVGYQDSYKAKHNRRIELTENDFKIYDNVSGFKTKAVLRWRLNPSDWVFKNGVLTDGKINIDIQSDAEILRNELTIGWESRYYWKKKEIPVLEVELQLAGNIITTISWI